MKESEVNWFRPLWRRVLVTAILAVWLASELLFSHDQLWIGITAVGLIYCVWNFFLRFPKDIPAPAEPASPEPPKQP